MKTCCQDLPNIACSIIDINKRIVPIQYIDDTLFIDSFLSLETFLSIGNAEILETAGHLDLPSKTLINGVPLLSNAFNEINLPSNTKINGYFPVTEHFYYYFTAVKGNRTQSGYIVNGYPSTIPKISPNVQFQSTYGFAFTAPEDCVLTSLKVLCVLRTTTTVAYPSPKPTNISIVLDVMDTFLNIYYTGVSMEIVSPSANSRNFVEQEFEYLIRKGDSAGVYIVGTIDGTTDALGTISAFATLGYTILPPTLSASSSKSSALLRSLYQSSSVYNRFPFNQIMNSCSKIPILFEDQLNVLKSSREPSELYGKQLTTLDYENRSVSLLGEMWQDEGMLTPPMFSKQDIFAFLFCNQKLSGSFLEIISSNHSNTNELESKFQWKGILFGSLDQQWVPEDRPLTFFSSFGSNTDLRKIISEQEMPSFIDYMNFDIPEYSLASTIFETLIPIFHEYSFRIITVKNRDDDLQSLFHSILMDNSYVRIFAGVLIPLEDGSSVREDWYVHENVLEKDRLDKIVNHAKNSQNLNLTICINIVLQVYEIK